MKHKVLAWILMMSLLLTIVPAFAVMEVEGEESEIQTVEEVIDELEEEAAGSELLEEQEDLVEADMPVESEQSGEAEQSEEAAEPSEPAQSEENEAPAEPEMPAEPEVPSEPEISEVPEAEEPAEDKPVTPKLPAGEVLVAPVPFYAQVRIEFKHVGDLFYGDEVTLHAVVEANADEYTVAWQYYNEEYDANDEESVEWITCGSGEDLRFTVTEANAKRIFRAVVNGEFISGRFVLPEAAEKPAAEEPTDPDLEEPETEENPEVEQEPNEEAPDAEEPEAEEEPEAKDETEVGSEPEEKTKDKGKNNQKESSEKEATPYQYAYERDEDGNLVLDENGNPIAIVPEGVDIPVAFQRDEDGNLVLDEDGNPIPTQFVPQTAHKVTTLEDQLDPNRTIDIYADWGEGDLAFGMESTLIAVLHGYDNAVYSIGWQVSADAIHWVDVADADEVTYTMVVTEENYLNYWRVVVTITDVTED